jgi:SOS-response transcriptional repressor LexA
LTEGSNVPEWSSAILALRQRLGLSQSEFGSRLHYSAMAVSRWETGKQEPTARCFIQLGSLTDQPESWLFWARAGLKSSDLRRMFNRMDADARTTSSLGIKITRAGARKRGEGSTDLPKEQLVAVPILDMHVGAIGQTGSQLTDFDAALANEIIAAPASWCPNPTQINCLRVEGNSMSPTIMTGDIVAIDSSQTNPKELNRKIVVASHRQNGLSLARFIDADGVHLLESENRDSSPVTVNKDKKWQIVGKVLWWIRKAP